MTFTIAGTSYKALEGMTWEEWVKSDYAPKDDYCSISAGREFVSVLKSDVRNNEGIYVLPSDLIINEHQYQSGASSEPA